MSDQELIPIEKPPEVFDTGDIFIFDLSKVEQKEFKLFITTLFRTLIERLDVEGAELVFVKSIMRLGFDEEFTRRVFWRYVHEYAHRRLTFPIQP